uniref:PH domain-containing protein n=1 Tax=Sinocyclocheilus rhinocerous TaxID=307959 RepID=A0A673FYV9_9TELE
MASDEYNPVILVNLLYITPRMSRRRVSVKDLDPVDHQGWLYRKKEGKGFLGIKWKKYWFVLKKTSLYWYTNQVAEKAEGFINLTDFVIDRAMEFIMFNSGKLCDEASDHEESTDTPPPPYSEHHTQAVANASGPSATVHQGSLPPPYSSPVPSEATGTLSSPVSTMNSHSSVSSLAKHRRSWLDLVSQATPTAGETVVCSAVVHTMSTSIKETSQHREATAPSQDPLGCSSSTSPMAISTEPEEPETQLISTDTRQERTDDEMERLYLHLKRASLSPTGERKPSSKWELRASFIKRSKNQTLNEKIHLIRTLNSTLKAKEADLLTLEQVVADSTLTASKFREWKETNAVLLQEIILSRPLQTEPLTAPSASAVHPST